MKVNAKLYWAYEVVMAVLALIVFVIFIVEMAYPLEPDMREFLNKVDSAVLIVFTIDYFSRFIKAQNKWMFFKNNIFDLLAIIPFDKAFRIARIARLARLFKLSRSSKTVRILKLTKFFRISMFLRRFWETARGILCTNGLVYIIVVTVFIVIGGAVGLLILEPEVKSFGDALWWSLVTTTTVGYGDISPKSVGGRILAGFLMIVGIGFLGMVTGSIATYFMNGLSKKRSKKENHYRRTA